MKNFYYVLTYNIHHPKVNSILHRNAILETTESLIDFKIRSKLYVSYKESVERIHDDISKKIPAIFPNHKKGEQHPLKVINLMNPAFAIGSEMSEKLFEKYGAVEDYWDDKCCSSIFLSEASEYEDESEMPAVWMFKYEIFFVEDAIEISKNGEYAFHPVNIPFSSTYQ